jgi:hypothetical protein
LIILSRGANLSKDLLSEALYLIADPSLVLSRLLLLLLIEGILPVDLAESDHAVYPECAGDHVYQVLYDAQEYAEAEVAGGERPELGPAVEGPRPQDREDEPGYAQEGLRDAVDPQAAEVGGGLAKGVEAIAETEHCGKGQDAHVYRG